MRHIMTDEFIQRLKKAANQSTWPEYAEEQGEDYFDASDYSGENFDDAYDGGLRDGEIELAREVLTELGIDWKE